ncbi:MAG: DUF3459 domain-containing protein, partial [Anaerolineae bacterium]|nr:DUF3459 domain-containing protein [Anaerolineae bacterium]
NASPVTRIFDISAADIAGYLSTNAITVTHEVVTLDDGREAEAISIVLDNKALNMVGFDPNSPDPIEQLIFAAITGNPLGVTFVFDGDQVIGYAFALQIAVEDVDISSAPDVPAGYTISLDLWQTFTATLNDINADLPLVAAPDIAFPGLDIFGAPPVVTGDYPWWNDRVFYEVFVRSFYDSNGDGIGDLQGVIEKLDYLNDGDPTTTDDLGVTGIWLMPIAQSPSYHGYDVFDYYNIETDYGTNADFRALLEAAHERGIVVIVDLVLNHTSNAHPWFVAAESGDPEYEPYYIWADNPPDHRSPWGSSVWHRAGSRYYFGLFWSGMPDLNYEHPAVTEEMYDVIDFWLTDMGVDGFRLDAIRHLDEDGPIMENTPETLAWLEDFHVYVHDRSPDALTVGEVWDATANVVPYVGDKVNIAFEFDFASAILTAAQLKSASPVAYALDTIVAAYPEGQYATFITNHDQNRVFSQLDEDEGAAQVAATLLLTGPGVPFIYYGEEIGMVGEKPDERIRTPMQWTDARINGGFTEAGQPWQTMASGYRTRNVATLTGDPDSLLSHYRALIHLRNAHPALSTGAIQLIETGNAHVFAMLRANDEETLLVLVNLDDDAVTDYALSATATLLSGDLTAEVVLGSGTADTPALTAAGGFAEYAPFDELAPRSSTVIVLQ